MIRKAFILSCLLTHCMLGYLYAQPQTININIENTTISKALERIETLSGYRFIFSTNHADFQKLVTVSIENKSIAECLDILLYETNLEYSFLGNSLIGITPSSEELLDLGVRGKVTDSGGAPLTGVTVYEKGTTNGTISDYDGNYSFTLQSKDAVIVFSYMGFLTEEVAWLGKPTINISLMESIESLSEVIVIGYGIQQKSLVTGSISRIGGDDLTQTQNLRLEQALQGKTSGVMISQNSGSPGAPFSVRVRGTGSNRQSQPLFLVDGMRVGDISYLESNDIESVEILKDAASAAIYGAEGANGVVLITTKQGKKGRISINYDGYHSFQNFARKMDLMNASQYAQYYREALRFENSGKDEEWIDQQFPFHPDTLGMGTDWQDAVFQRNVPMMRHYLSFSGGSEQSKYFASLGYFGQEGIIGGSKADFNRYTVRLNSTHDVKNGSHSEIISLILRLHEITLPIITHSIAQ
jgi:TonB-dependent starch-binding outer membrane protein SusC